MGEPKARVGGWEPEWHRACIDRGRRRGRAGVERHAVGACSKGSGASQPSPGRLMSGRRFGVWGCTSPAATAGGGAGPPQYTWQSGGARGGAPGIAAFLNPGRSDSVKRGQCRRHRRRGSQHGDAGLGKLDFAGAGQQVVHILPLLVGAVWGGRRQAGGSRRQIVGGRQRSLRKAAVQQDAAGPPQTLLAPSRRRARAPHHPQACSGCARRPRPCVARPCGWCPSANSSCRWSPRTGSPTR
jgi:hypothetical protein